MTYAMLTLLLAAIALTVPAQATSPAALIQHAADIFDRLPRLPAYLD
jgi:hypothetical protein